VGSTSSSDGQQGHPDGRVLLELQTLKQHGPEFLSAGHLGIVVSNTVGTLWLAVNSALGSAGAGYIECICVQLVSCLCSCQHQTKKKDEQSSEYNG